MKIALALIAGLSVMLIAEAGARLLMATSENIIPVAVFGVMLAGIGYAFVRLQKQAELDASQTPGE